MWRLYVNSTNNGVLSAVSRLAALVLVRVPHDHRWRTGLHLWPRTDETCRELLALLTPFNTGMITSDDWGSYAREVPKDNHLTGKIFTQRIERNNLTLRTRIKRLARRTIGFSRSVELHEKVIGAFIEKYLFY